MLEAIFFARSVSYYYYYYNDIHRQLIIDVMKLFPNCRATYSCTPNSCGYVIVVYVSRSAIEDICQVDV